MKQLLFTNWHLMRWVRLAFALFLFAQAYITHEWFFLAFGLFFLFQVIFNLGSLNFVGSSGLTPFLDLLKDMKKTHGHNIKICSAQKDFVRLFEGGELSQLEIYETEEKAHNAFVFAQFMAEARRRSADGVIKKVRSFGLDYPLEEDGE